MATVTAFSHTVRDPAELPDVLARAAEVFESRRPRPGPRRVAARRDQAAGRRADAVRGAPTAAARAAGGDRPRGAATRGAPSPARAARRRRQGRRARGAGARAAARRADRSDDQRPGTVPHDDELCLGSALSFEPVSALLRDADATLLVGAQLSDLDLWGLTEPLTLRGLIRVDIDPEQLDRRWPAEVPLCGDAARRSAICSRRLTGTPTRLASRTRGAGRRRPGAAAPAAGGRALRAVARAARPRAAGGPDRRRGLDSAGVRRQPPAAGRRSRGPG